MTVPQAGAHSGVRPPADGPGPGRPAVRDRYLDLLRAVALVRVVVYHCFGWAWLTLVFPSMGVMFALAGSLMARSLARPAAAVLRSRTRRLLPPVWVLASLLVPAMVIGGWRPSADGGGPLGWGLRLLWWIVPLGTPPYPWELGHPNGLLEVTWADDAAGPLWYLRTYLWFVLLSPLLLKAFRRLPWATLTAPLVLTAVLTTGLVTLPGDFGAIVMDLVTFGSCWLLGFAHHDGLLRRLPPYVVPVLAPVFMAAGAWWAFGHRTESGWDLDEIPLGQALWSFGFVVVLLRISPSWERLPRPLARLDGLVSLLNARAVTFYLWHQIALIASVPLIDRLWDFPVLEYHVRWLLDSEWFQFAVVWPLIGLLLVCFGWAEDLAARRPARLWPWPRRRTAAAGG
ncbi:acyltransferase [Streptomyces sp. ME01-24h]|nr:acyltransferase [Streptomyces sp. ME01-24h]